MFPTVFVLHSRMREKKKNQFWIQSDELPESTKIIAIEQEISSRLGYGYEIMECNF